MTTKIGVLSTSQGNCQYCCENKGCELSAKFSFIQSKLSSQWKSHRQSIHHGYCMKEFPSTNTIISVRLQGKKQSLEEIISFYGLEWKTWHVKNPYIFNWAPSSEFVSSSIPSWQISTAHAQPFRGARDLAFCLKVPLDSLLVWASSGGSGETARMRRLAWTFAARIGDKYQIRLTRSNCK